ncbi:hypothetical protein Tco_1141013 [Tanacetum coccineum]
MVKSWLLCKLVQDPRLLQKTSEQLSSGLRLHLMTSEQLGSGLRLHQIASEIFSSGPEPQTIYNETTRKLPVVEVKGKGSATDRWIIASQDETTRPSVHPEDATSTKMVRETLSHADAESGGNLEKINSETDTEILNARSNTEQSHVALARPNPEPMHDDFLTTIYPKVHKSLKHTTEEHVHLENPPSSSETLSSMKNLEDNFTFGDQFINDKSQEDKPGKSTVETELESMVIIPIQQASSSIPPLSTLVIDLSPPKPMSPPFQEPIIVNFHHQHPHYNRAEQILKWSDDF